MMVKITYKDSTIQKGHSHGFCKKMFTQTVKPEYSTCFAQGEK